MIQKNELKTLERIKNYLGSGGLFNPELMEHAKVRDLIMDCREKIQSRDAEILELKYQNETYRTISIKLVQAEYEIEKRDKLLAIANYYFDWYMKERVDNLTEAELQIRQWLKQYEEMKK